MEKSKILKSISISFDEDELPIDEVEMNLEQGATPPRPKNTSAYCNNGRDESIIDTSFKDESPESRNDKEPSFSLSSSVPPYSLFRSREMEESIDKTDAILENRKDFSFLSLEESKKSNDTIYQAISAIKQSTQLPKKLDSFDHDVHGTRCASLNHAYSEQRSQTESPKINNRSLLSRADEIIMEARKVCALSPKSLEIINRTKSVSSSSPAGRDEIVQQLSTKEVLELATSALRPKEGQGSSKKPHIEPAEKGQDQDFDSSGIGPGPAGVGKKLCSNTTTTTTANQQTNNPIEAEEGINTKMLSNTFREAHFKKAQYDETETLMKLQRSLSPADSECASIETEDGARHLPPFLSDLTSRSMASRDSVLKRVDGIENGSSRSIQQGRAHFLNHSTRQATKNEVSQTKDSSMVISLMNYFWGGETADAGETDDTEPVSVPMSCGPQQLIDEENEQREKFSAVTKFLRSNLNSPCNAETIGSSTKLDPRLQAWIDGQFARKEELLADGTYQFGKSRTVIVHEIMRGNWTWDTAWSPDGNRLAVATENHHLSVIDTASSVVWRVRHDRRLLGPVRNGTTHSIRCIAWGSQFIAIGGTGDAVSILAPTEPYPILHTILGVGFVGALNWKADSAVLAIGTRFDKALIVRIRASDNLNLIDGRSYGGMKLESEVVHVINRKHWVNAVKFSPGGTVLAIGDSSGTVSVYSFDDRPETPVDVSLIKNFSFDDAILDVDWSPDGKWLYAGGEDFKLSMIDTNYWEVVRRIQRNRWVQFAASSRGGSHVAVGGVTSEVSLLEVSLGWETVINIELKGLVPLSGSWHPKDQYLALTGQNNSILVVETTNARHVTGHFLRSISPILSVEFSPDGRMAVIGNEMGVVTFYMLTGSSFVTVYELVVTTGSSLCIEWSPYSNFVAIGSDDTLVIVGRAQTDQLNRDIPPNSSGFSVQKIIRGLGAVHSISIECQSRYIAVSGDSMSIYDASADFACIRSFKSDFTFATAWSPDGRWMATIGQSRTLTIYDTDYEQCQRWREVFSLQGGYPGLSLAWGPVIVGELQYLAFGGEDKTVTIVEIRTNEGTWETVLIVQRDDIINDLDWNREGLLAVALGNGTVSIIDLSYLQSGMAVNQMDYKWQRQALTCFTEIRRNRGKNCMQTVRWIPSVPGSYSLLAIGGTDGEVEIVDLTERKRCKGYSTE